MISTSTARLQLAGSPPFTSPVERKKVKFWSSTPLYQSMRRLLYADSIFVRTPPGVLGSGIFGVGATGSSPPPPQAMTPLVATNTPINIHAFILIFITCREFSLRRLCLTLARAQRCQGVVTEIAEFHQLPMMIVFSVRPRVADREHGFCASG